MKEAENNGWKLKPGEKEDRNKLPDPSNGVYPKSKESDTSSEPEIQDDEVPSISFITLFRFATPKDTFFIVMALIFSMIAACSTPINTLLIAALLEAMVKYGMSIVMNAPDSDMFLEAVFYFAVYNSIVGALLILLSYAATTLMNIAAYNQVYVIRQEYLKAALNQDFAYYDIHKNSDIATKINSDVVKLEEGIGEKLATFVFYQASFFSSVIMALIKGWKLALLCLISFPVTITLVGVAGLVAARLSKKEAVATGKAGAIAEEVISAIRTVYAFSGQKKELERYESHLIDAKKINVKKGLFNGLAMGLLFFCIFCAYALSFWFGYRLMVDEPENYDVSTMIAVFFGVMTGSGNFGISSTLMEVFGGARGAGAQIFNMIDNVPTINPLQNKGTTPSTIEGNIELKNVVFHYPSRPDVSVLKGVNLSVKRGQSVALVGHSGCGKSTIIQLISRFYDVIDGSVAIDGRDVRDLSVRWLRAQIGLVGQEPVLFNTTVRENIRYGREDATNEEIEACARQANAHQFIMKLPKGYDTLVGERGASLSGGQKQRIAIARALVRNPRILLLDEATSALDTSSEAKVQKAIDKAQQGRTTIVVAHRLSTIRNVDVIYVFKSGNVVEVGNHAELMKTKGHYYDMVMLQNAPGSEDNIENKLTRESSVRSEHDDEDEFSEIKTTDPDEVDETVPDISFWRVLKLNKPEWKSVTVASICSLMSGFSMPLLAVIFGDFIGVLSNPNKDEVLQSVRTYSLIFVGIGIFSGITNFIVVFFYGMAGESLTKRLRMMMFEKLLQQEVAFYDDKNNSTGALCARLSGEAAAVQGATGQRIGTVLQAVGTFGFALVLALIYEWRVGLVALTFVPIIMFVLYKQGRMTYAEASGTAKTMETSSKIAVEAVANIRTVASLGREETFRNDYSKQLLPALVAAKKSSHWRGLVFGLSRGIFNFVIASSLYYGGTLIVNEGIDYSVVFKSAQALLLGASSAAQAFAFAPNFQKGIKAAGRVIVLLNRQSKITDPAHRVVHKFKGTGEASLQNIRFRYPTRPMIEVLKNLNLEIERGKTLALVGASGCGKSTVIQLLERYYDPDEGIVAQDGVPLPKLRLVDSRRAIGFVQQEPVLFDRTIGENIAYGDNENSPSMDDIISAAKQANIHNFITSLPLAQQGRTTIVVAHRLSTIRNVDVIYVFKSGNVVEVGNHAELMKTKGHYYDMVMLQNAPGSEDNIENKLTRESSVRSEHDDEDEFSEIKTTDPDEVDETVPDISFWRVLKLNKPEWKSVTVASICSLMSGFSMPLLAVIFGDFIGVLSNPNKDEVLQSVRTYSLIFVGIGIFSGITNFIVVFFYGMAGESLTKRLRMMMFEKLLQQEVAFYDDKNNSTGALCARLSGEAAAVQGATGQRIGTVLQAVGTFGFALVLALIYEWRVGLVALTFVPIIMFVLYKQGRMTYAEASGTAKTMETSSKIAVEAVANIRTVASLGREETFRNDYSKQLLPALVAAKKSSHWRGLVFGLSRGIFNFVIASSLYYGGTLIVNEGIDYSVVFKSAQALLLGASSAAQAFAFAPNFQKGIKAAGRVIVLLNRQSKITDPAHRVVHKFKGTGEASLQNIRFRYPTRPMIEVLKNLNLEIERGKTLALVGASGCGKSTVIQLLERYYDPDEGIVAQDGVPLPKLRLVDSRRAIGFVQQEPVLFDRTIGENIAYGDNENSPSMDDIISAAKQANIHNFITSLPLGYETNIGSKGTQLSGGQKQRVAIARALIRRPKMLLLDEATSALDTESEKVVQEALDAAKAGRTCVMIAHRLSTVRDADVICVIHNGQVAEMGKHSELLELKGLYYNLNRRGYA